MFMITYYFKRVSKGKKTENKIVNIFFNGPTTLIRLRIIQYTRQQLKQVVNQSICTFIFFLYISILFIRYAPLSKLSDLLTGARRRCQNQFKNSKIQIKAT